MSPLSALLVINRKSRRGAEAADAVTAALADAGIAVVEDRCEEAAGLSRLIARHAGRIDRVIVGGGDGTLNAALPAVLETGLPLGILPLGTANDLARTLDIPADPVAAVRIIAAGRRRRVDVGEANGHPFFNVASVGFGVDLTRALTRDAKKRWGTLGYAVAAIRALQRMSRFSATITQPDGSEWKSRTLHLAVGNGRHYGGGMTVSESAAIDDGRLNVYSLEVEKRWRLLFLLPSMRRGDHGKWEEVRTMSGTDFTLHTRQPRSVNTDGEITTRTPVHFRVRPGAVEVFAPTAPAPQAHTLVGGALASMAVNGSKIS